MSALQALSGGRSLSVSSAGSDSGVRDSRTRGSEPVAPSRGRARRWRGSFGALGALCLSALGAPACSSPQYGNTCPVPENATEAQAAEALARCYSTEDSGLVSDRLPDVDILFVIDNSPSMAPKQQALSANINRFIAGIENLKINYHLGIVTTDVGTTQRPGEIWSSGNIGSCNSYAGDDGALQAIPCTARKDLQADAKNACASLCPDPGFVPSGGQRYISKIDGKTNVPQALIPDPKTGQMIDEGPSRAFRCMALVGDVGCGVESPLEAAKRALDGHLSSNSGFLRPNSVLAIIFITDEDDCSVQLGRRSENSPLTRSCDPSQPDSFDCYDIDFRCLARSTQCDQTLLTPGTKTNCKERPDSYLEPVSKYHKFFSELRPKSRLAVAGIWTLPSLQGGGKLVVSGDPNLTQSLQRAKGADASCMYAPSMGAVFGQAQHRLSSFASLFGKDASGMQPEVAELSICNIDGYAQALDEIGERVVRKLKPCLDAVPKTNAAGTPICLVGDVDAETPNASPSVAFPACSTSCCKAWGASGEPSLKDPTIQAACSKESAEACYCAVPSTAGVCEKTVLGVWRRNAGDPPPGKVTPFRCAAQ
jgi:hypothetical protein